MLPYIHIILPSYSVLAFIGGFTVLVFLYFRFEDFGLSFNNFLKLFLVCVVTCFLGSKLLYAFVAVMTSTNSLTMEEILLTFLQSGYVFFGGLFGVLFGVWLTTKFIPQLDIDSLSQMIAPALPLFHGFGRIGCLLTGCCYGISLNPPITLAENVYLTRLPVQLFESMYEFALFAVLYLLGKKYKKIKLLPIYLLGYSIFRFFIEFYRADADRGFWFDMSTSQWIALSITVYFLAQKIINKKKIFRF